MKKQQETMKLYNKAGVNPMAGCLPGLYANASILCFISVLSFELSLKTKFLWAEMIYLHSIQFMIYHFIFLTVVILVCLILASIAIFFLYEMTTGDQQMQAQQKNAGYG
jgi:YidC/Oxa1 family membrane protein insertase